MLCYLVSVLCCPPAIIIPCAPSLASFPALLRHRNLAEGLYTRPRLFHGRRIPSGALPASLALWKCLPNRMFGGRVRRLVSPRIAPCVSRILFHLPISEISAMNFLFPSRPVRLVRTVGLSKRISEWIIAFHYGDMDFGLTINEFSMALRK